MSKINIFNIKKLLIVFAVLEILFIICTAIFEPLTYPIGYMMIGRGRFADFFDTFREAAKYPSLGSYCIAPWHYLLLKFSNNYLNINYLFLLYNFLICVVIGKILLAIEKFSPNSRIVLLTIFTYPFLFGIWRGNPEVLAILFLFLSIINIDTNKNLSYAYFWTCVFIKPNTIFYGLIYIDKFKRTLIYSALIFGLIIFILTISFDGLADIYEVSKSCLKSYSNDYIHGEGGTFLNNSLYGMVKYYIYSSNNNYIYASSMMLDFYNIFTKYWIIFYITLSLLSIYFLSGALRIYVIFASFILLYPISADYRLISLIIPLSLMVISKRIGDYGSIILMILFLLFPKHIWNTHLTNANILITVNSFLNPLILAISIIYCFVRR